MIILSFRDMNYIIQEQLQWIYEKGFSISDTIKTRGYLEQVGIFWLYKYFHLFESERQKGNRVDFQRVIDCYIFDKNLRMYSMNILESIEVFLKNQMVLLVGNEYQKPDVYAEKFRKHRLEFIEMKLEEL